VVSFFFFFFFFLSFKSLLCGDRERSFLFFFSRRIDEEAQWMSEGRRASLPPASSGVFRAQTASPFSLPTIHAHLPMQLGIFFFLADLRTLFCRAGVTCFSLSPPSPRDRNKQSFDCAHRAFVKFGFFPPTEFLEGLFFFPFSVRSDSLFLRGLGTQGCVRFLERSGILSLSPTLWLV